MRPFGILALVTALVFALVPAPFASADPVTPSVSISGTIVTGQPLDAVVSGIEGEIAYEWRIDGVPTRLESWPTGYPVPPDRFFLYEEFLGKQLSVSATVAPTTGEPVVLTSASHTIEQGGFLANRPTVTGELRVGQTLTASHNILYPTEGVSITYQWLLWQMPIPGATGATLTLLPEHVGLQNVRVEVTAAKDGWPTHVRKSQALHGEVIPERLEPGRVRLDRPVARETVTFHEDWGPGEDLVTVSIQWLLDGRELPGMTAPTITVDPAWVGAKLAVRVTKQRRDGSAAVAVTSEAHEVMGQTITGWGRLVGRQAVVGWPLSYEPVSIPPGVTQKVQWVRVDAQGRETPITGVQGRHYRVTAADIGYRVGVRYTLSGPGYTTVSAVNLTPNATPLNVYTTPGRHTVNGREWRTSCEPYLY